VYVLPHAYDAFAPPVNSRPAIAALIARLGGVAQPSASSDTVFAVGSTVDARASLLVSGKETGGRPVDVYKPTYLVACQEAGALLPPEPEWFVQPSPATQERLLRVVDRWGDHMVKPVTPDSLLRLFAGMKPREVEDCLHSGAGGVGGSGGSDAGGDLDEDSGVGVASVAMSFTPGSDAAELWHHELATFGPGGDCHVTAYFAVWEGVPTTRDASDSVERVAYHPCVPASLRFRLHRGTEQTWLDSAVDVVVVDQGSLSPQHESQLVAAVRTADASRRRHGRNPIAIVSLDWVDAVLQRPSGGAGGGGAAAVAPRSGAVLCAAEHKVALRGERV